MTIPLSPSRASDFKSCPQLFKFRAVDRLPEPTDPAGLRGTIVHSSLEALFALPAPERVPSAIPGLIRRAWEALAEPKDPSQLELGQFDPTFGLTESEREEVDQESNLALERYFQLEDPRTVRHLNLEWWVEHEGSKSSLRGIIDRVDLTPEGAWILTDYKTGRSPSETYALGSFFALKFYALVCWRTYGKMPKALRLLHLREPEEIRLEPTRSMLEGTEQQLQALGVAIAKAFRNDDWRPRPSHVCNWCPHRNICPAWESKDVAEAV